MGKRTTYCEVEFLKKFSERYIPLTSPFEEEILRKNQCWLGLFHFMQEKTKLLIDNASLFNALAQENDFCRRIKKLWANGSLEISEQKIDLSSCMTDTMCSYVFLCDDCPMAVKIAKDYGVFVITPSSYDQCVELYKVDGKAIHKGEVLDWTFLKKKKEKFNTMVITDKYILQERQNNLYVLFDVLLPKCLKMPMHISLFTLDSPTFEEDFKTINAYIKSIRPQLHYNFTLHKAADDDFHDRAIITNYMRIKCGAGFDLVKNHKGVKVARTTTEIEIDYPYFSDTELSVQSYENILQDAKRMYNTNLCYGIKNNRLLVD